MGLDIPLNFHSLSVMKTRFYPHIFILVFAAFAHWFASPSELMAGVAVEAGEAVVHAATETAARQSVDEVAQTSRQLIVRYGEDAAKALRRMGRAGAEAIEKAGDQGMTAARLLAEHGDEALPLVRRPECLTLVERLGDDAAQAMMRHPGLAEDLLSKQGNRLLAQALRNLSQRNARRLAMLTEEGFFNATPRSQELLQVVRQYGDAAMDFVWRNKGALTVVTVLASFLEDPKPYIDGIHSFGATVTKPVAEHVGRAFESALPWVLAAAGCVFGLLALSWSTRRRVAPCSTSQASTET